MKGFTLLELLVAVAVAAILTGSSIRVFGMFQHGMVESSYRYGLFVTDRALDLRCRTRFVRGLESCDSTMLGNVRKRF